MHDLDKYQNLESYTDVYFFYPIADLLMPFFHDVMHLKPNNITTIGFIFRIIAAYMILLKKYRYGAGLYLIGYLFDSMDGRMARHYKESSLWGEAWDSVADTTSTIIVISALIYSVKGKICMFQWGLLALFIILMNIWSYTQESWAVFKKTGDYDVLKFKKDRFKNQDDIISKFYIWINEGAMGVDKLFDLTGGFKEWKDILLFTMPIIGCGNLMVLLCFIVISFDTPQCFMYK
jgi:phosphatidylglycerophosphate synthase